MTKKKLFNILFFNFWECFSDKLSLSQIDEFFSMLFLRWANKFNKIFLTKAVHFCTKRSSDGSTELEVLRDDFKYCFECYCKEFCND